MKPLSPAAARIAFNKSLPDFVIESANELIVEHMNASGCSSFTFKELGARIKSKKPDDVEYNDNWLDIEDAFREAGWKVEVDSPGYNETYAGHYNFSPKRG